MTRIKQLRIHAGLTQEQLAHRSRLAFCTINRIENGHRQPTETTSRRICKALRISVRKWRTLTDEVQMDTSFLRDASDSVAV